MLYFQAKNNSFYWGFMNLHHLAPFKIGCNHLRTLIIRKFSRQEYIEIIEINVYSSSLYSQLLVKIRLVLCPMTNITTAYHSNLAYQAYYCINFHILLQWSHSIQYPGTKMENENEGSKMINNIYIRQPIL